MDACSCAFNVSNLALSNSNALSRLATKASRLAVSCFIVAGICNFNAILFLSSSVILPFFCSIASSSFSCSFNKGASCEPFSINDLKEAVAP